METKLLSNDRPIALHYALLSEIISYSEESAARCTVVLSEPWKLIHTQIGSIYIKETSPETAAGIKHVTQITAICPGHSNLVSSSADSIQGRRVIVKAVYRSGKEKIIGNNHIGPKLYFDTASGQITERRLESTWENTSQNLYHT